MKIATLKHKAITITITYDVVSEKSAQDGDTRDHGFANEHGDLFSIADAKFRRMCNYRARKGMASGRAGAVQAQAKRAGQLHLTIREAYEFLSERGPFEASSWPARPESDWLTPSESELGEPRFSYHLKATDPRALRALFRALGVS